MQLIQKYRNSFKLGKSKDILQLGDILSFIACSLTILWGELCTWILDIDSAGRIPRLLLICAFFFSFNSIKKTSFKIPLILYLLLGVYMFINGYIKGGQNSYPQDGIYRLFIDALTAPFMLLILVNLFSKHFDKSLKIFTILLYIYTILFFLFTDYEDKGGYVRLDGGVNANEAALHIAVCFLLILLLYIKKHIKLPITILMSIFPLWIIMQTGSRMGLTMCTIAVFGAYLICYNRKNKIKILFIICILVVGVAFILNNTMIGERMASTTTQAEEARWATGTAWDLLGDRGIAYYMSWPYFLEQPITGVGFRKWSILNPLGFIPHSEYLVMYLENGIIAFSFFTYIMVQLFKRLNHYRKQKKNTKLENNTARFLICCLIVILVADTMLWTFNEYGVFIIYAMCFAFPSIQTMFITANRRKSII